MKAGVKKALATACAPTLAAIAGLTAFPLAAFANEEAATAEGATEGAAGISAILPDMAEFIPMLVCFIALCIVLAKFGWPMFAAMLDKREASIKESLERSEAARIESERLLQEYRQQLDEAKAQAATIIADAKKTGEAAMADLGARAQAEADGIIAKARAAIEAEKKAAIAELQSTVADTSIAVASRLIGTDLDDAEHRRVVERYVNEAGTFNAH